MEFRTIRPHERDSVLDLLAEWLHDRAFFARYFTHDPTFRDDLCFVAVDRGRIVSTLQVFRKAVQLDTAVVSVAGVGNVFTTEAYRTRGLASHLLTRAVDAMEAHGFDLSLLFATRLAFYGRHGWRSHVRHLLFIEPAAVSAAGPYRIDRFTPTDLPAVMQVYDRYTAGRVGPTRRDATYWQGQLRYAGNPQETFLVARAGDAIVAYARGTTLYDYYVIMEHAHLPGHSDALTQLVCRLHGTEAAMLPGTITHLTIAPDVADALRARGLTTHHVEDVFWMWRVIAPSRLAARLGVPEDDLDRDDTFTRLLPPEGSVYWIADRF
jgi:GNAT superfamily N-acetyltransferase